MRGIASQIDASRVPTVCDPRMKCVDLPPYHRLVGVGAMDRKQPPDRLVACHRPVHLLLVIMQQELIAADTTRTR
ncbi:hypothetical protein D9M72_648540 [compost metagenome]